MAKQIIAVIGAGGKTTAMGVLSRQCRGQSVFVTTTTHIYPMSLEHCDRCLTDPDVAELTSALSESGVVCAGTASAGGKLTMLPEGILNAGIAAAETVIYEGDGSRGLPLKLHREDEPVLLPGTTSYLAVAGLSALGRSVSDAVHRCELAPELKEIAEGYVDAQVFAACVLEMADRIGCSFDRVRVFLNQEDCCRRTDQVQEISRILREHGLKVKSGNLRTPPENLYDWIVNG